MGGADSWKARVEMRRGRGSAMEAVVPASIDFRNAPGTRPCFDGDFDAGACRVTLPGAAGTGSRRQQSAAFIPRSQRAEPSQQGIDEEADTGAQNGVTNPATTKQARLKMPALADDRMP